MDVLYLLFTMCPNDQLNIDKLRSNCAVRHQNLDTPLLMLEVDRISHHYLLSKILHLQYIVDEGFIAVSDIRHRRYSRLELVILAIYTPVVEGIPVP